MTGNKASAAAIDNEALVLDLLEWLGARQRPYAEVMDAWRTSCPRLPIWEDALGLRFVACRSGEGAGLTVGLTPGGRAFLEARRP